MRNATHYMRIGTVGCMGSIRGKLPTVVQSPLDGACSCTMATLRQILNVRNTREESICWVIPYGQHLRGRGVIERQEPWTGVSKAASKSIGEASGIN